MISRTSPLRSRILGSRLSAGRQDEKISIHEATALLKLMAMARENLAAKIGGRGTPCPPDVYGQSQLCHRQRRKSRLRALGIGGQRR